jgi:hypothetical protein
VCQLHCAFFCSAAAQDARLAYQSARQSIFFPFAFIHNQTLLSLHRDNETAMTPYDDDDDDDVVFDDGNNTNASNLNDHSAHRT